jgi:hypothetical protein
MIDLFKRQRRGCLEAMILLSFLVLTAYSMSALAAHMSPPKGECPQPRNFACAAKVEGIPDGHALDYQEWFARNGHASFQLSDG